MSRGSMWTMHTSVDRLQIRIIFLDGMDACIVKATVWCPSTDGR
jgi:hypothetical protein